MSCGGRQVPRRGWRELIDDAFLVAARTLASLVRTELLTGGTIYPPVSDLRTAARAIAEALVFHLRDTGYGRQFHDGDVAAAVDRAMWWPDYLPYIAG